MRVKTAIVGDDVIMTGGTLIANLEALRAQGVEGFVLGLGSDRRS